MDFNGKTVAIIGVAKSGIAAARLLKGLGANIIMYDAKPKEAFPESLLESISDIGYEDMFGADIVMSHCLRSINSRIYGNIRLLCKTIEFIHIYPS